MPNWGKITNHVYKPITHKLLLLETTNVNLLKDLTTVVIDICGKFAADVDYTGVNFLPVSFTLMVHFGSLISSQMFEKVKMLLMELLGARGKMVHEKKRNKKSCEKIPSEHASFVLLNKFSIMIIYELQYLLFYAMNKRVRTKSLSTMGQNSLLIERSEHLLPTNKINTTLSLTRIS